MPSNLVLERPKLTSYQKRIIYSKARFTITEASTKAGKTFSHLWWIFEKAHTPQKTGANYWWIAPVYSQAKIAFTRLKRVAGRYPGYRTNETDLFIQTPIGSVIWFKSAEKPDNLYGEDVYAAVMDEFTRCREESWTALRSTLTATKGPCKFIGNVKGKKNWGYKLGLKARSGESSYEYFKVTAYDAANEGILDQEEIEQAKRDLPPDAFKELYLAEALDDQANPFGISFIRQQLKPLSNNRPVCFGIDLAKSVDWTVVTGLDQNGQICYFDRWQSDWNQTKNRITSIVGGLPAYIDSTGVGDPIAEDIRRSCPNVENYHFTQTSKQKLMEGLASSIQRGEVSVLPGVLQDEMEAFEFEYTRTGVKYTAPQGLHDDCVCSLALANLKRLNGTSVGVYTGFF